MFRNMKKLTEEQLNKINELSRLTEIEEQNMEKEQCLKHLEEPKTFSGYGKAVSKTVLEDSKTIQQIYDEVQAINNRKPSEKQLDELAEVINDKVDGGGQRDDSGKFRMDLVPSSMIYAMAKVMEVGSKKYSVHNWRRGMKWSKPYSFLMRHMQKWNDCEDLDSETNLSHLYHALANIAMLIEYETTCPELDDRYKGKVRDYKQF
jgi:hypothetical protein